MYITRNINMLLIDITCNFTLPCTELGLRIFLPFVWISTQAFGAGRLERGRPGAAKESVDTVRKNESVLLVQASDVRIGLKRRHMYSTCTCRCQCHSIVRRYYHRQTTLLNSTGTDSFN